MKAMNKLMLTVAGTLLLSGGAYLSYFLVQPAEQLSDLTLANIEALGSDKERGGGGVVFCSGGKLPCADVYDRDGNVIDQLTMP